MGSVSVARIAPSADVTREVHERIAGLANGASVRTIGNLHRVDDGPSWLVVPVQGDYHEILELPKDEADAVEASIVKGGAA